MSLWAQADRSTQLKNRLKGIDTLVQRVMSDWKVPGIAIAVVYKDQLLYTQGFGYRDLENKLPVTPHTVFHIASCSKAFTAMLVGMAADQQLLDIGKPVRDYFPELAFYTPQLTSDVTAKDMLLHRTGLPRHDWATHAKDPLPMDTVIRRIRYLPPSKTFRDEVQYNNLLYMALGELTSKVTGKSWESLIQEKIFIPLQMEESSAAFNKLYDSKEYSKGYTLRADTFATWGPPKEGANAAGSLNASVWDMSHWLMAWINNGVYKGLQVLPARFVREASMPQMSTPSRPNPNFPAYPDHLFGDLGYGWNIHAYRGHFQVEHSGDLPLFSSNTAFYPTDSIGIVVLANKFNATVPELISYSLADRLLELPYKDWNGLLWRRQHPVTTQNAQAASASPAPAPAMTWPLQSYAGTYYHPGYGFIKLALVDGKLVATHNEATFTCKPAGNNTFKADVPGGTLTATEDAQGRVIALSGLFYDVPERIVFVRQPGK